MNHLPFSNIHVIVNSADVNIQKTVYSDSPSSNLHSSFHGLGSSILKRYGASLQESLGSIFHQDLFGMQTTDASNFFRAEADIAKSDVCIPGLAFVAPRL